MAKPKKSAPSKKVTKNKKPAAKKAPLKKPPVKKTLPPKKAAGKKAAAKPAVKKSKPAKPTKKPVKKEPLKKVVPKTIKPAPKPAAKPAPAPKTAPAKDAKAAKKPAPPPEPAKKAAAPGKNAPKTPPSSEKQHAAAKPDNKRDQLRKNIIGGKKALRPTAFTLDEAREIAKTAVKSNGETAAAVASKTPAAPARPDLNKLAKSMAPIHVKAASLADILGFNPKKAQKPALFAPVDSIPEKYRRYYKLLLDLRTSLTEGLTLHTEETLRRSTKDDAGDLSSYGQHMADAGTDTFDRDFALSMVANEQEALTEIDAAIKRIENGTYGICEITQKPIAKERLLAVPFTRYSAEAQKDIEKNRMRVRTAAGLFGEGGDDSGRGDDGGGDEE